MAVRASIATGNFTTAGTWGTIDATSYLNTEGTTTALTTTYALSSTFTPGAITISHIGVKLSVRTGTTGTISVCLDQGGADVAGTTVTINTADLPVAATADLNGGWHFFKLASPVLLLAATLYSVKAKTSSASMISLFSAATTNWARALVTTTTGAPAAGDDLIVAGEYTGAGTSNSFTVTMNNTAATDFGGTSTSLVTPGLAICNKGTLSYGVAASTAYTIRLSGNAIVYSGGTFNMGTVGAEIPRNSSAELFFDCGANVDYGLTVRNLGTFRANGLSRTSGKDVYVCYLNTDEAIASTSLGVDTDTGWLDNDIISVASTTRTNTQCERGTLNGNAGASTLTVDGFAGAGGGLAFAHSGTSPTQAEVFLLTRNVYIRGASATLQSYVVAEASSTFVCKWSSFRWMGSATANKRGIDVKTTTGTFTLSYCSEYDFVVTSSSGLNISSTSGSNISISDHVLYNMTGGGIANVATSGAQTFSDVYMMLSTAQIGFSFGDYGSSYTNMVVIGCASNGFNISETGGIMSTPINGVTVHSCSSVGSVVGLNSVSTSIDNLTSWRNNGSGFQGSGLNVTLTSPVLFGNNGSNIQTSTSWTGLLRMYSPVLNGDTTFSTTSGITFNGSGVAIARMEIYNGDFGTASGIKTTHTTDINLGTSGYTVALLDNTKLSSGTEVSALTTNIQGTVIASQNHDQVAGSYKAFKTGGTITSESTTVHTGTRSIKMTPSSASIKLESSGAFGGFKCAVASGQTVTPTVYVYEDASYNGARARLIVKRNHSMGITSDTVLDTATAASDAAWEALTGTTAAVTADGTLEFVVDCNGTAGNLFVDSFSAV